MEWNRVALCSWYLGKKLPGRLPLSDRAFAFLVTPKLPAKRGEVEKLEWQRSSVVLTLVNRNIGLKS
jgi:hypothetical protein